MNMARAFAKLPNISVHFYFMVSGKKNVAIIKKNFPKNIIIHPIWIPGYRDRIRKANFKERLLSKWILLRFILFFLLKKFEENDSLSEKFCLNQNYPNPFHATTTIEYSIGEPTYVCLKIYDNSGRHIKTLVDKEMTPGRYAVRLEADDLLPGVYFYQLKAGQNCIKKRMLLIK